MQRDFGKSNDNTAAILGKWDDSRAKIFQDSEGLLRRITINFLHYESFIETIVLPS